MNAIAAFTEANPSYTKGPAGFVFIEGGASLGDGFIIPWRGGIGNKSRLNSERTLRPRSFGCWLGARRMSIRAADFIAGCGAGRADSDEAARLKRDNCAQGFLDDAAPL